MSSHVPWEIFLEVEASSFLVCTCSSDASSYELLSVVSLHLCKVASPRLIDLSTAFQVLLLISELCILGFSSAIFFLIFLDQTMKAFIGLFTLSSSSSPLFGELRPWSGGGSWTTGLQ